MKLNLMEMDRYRYDACDPPDDWLPNSAGDWRDTHIDFCLYELESWTIDRDELEKLGSGIRYMGEVRIYLDDDDEQIARFYTKGMSEAESLLQECADIIYG